MRLLDQLSCSVRNKDPLIVMTGIQMDILNRGTIRRGFSRIRRRPKPAYIKTADDQPNIAVDFDDLVADVPRKKVSTGNPPDP